MEGRERPVGCLRQFSYTETKGGKGRISYVINPREGREHMNRFQKRLGVVSIVKGKDPRKFEDV